MIKPFEYDKRKIAANKLHDLSDQLGSNDPTSLLRRFYWNDDQITSSTHDLENVIGNA